MCVLMTVYNYCGTQHSTNSSDNLPSYPPITAQMMSTEGAFRNGKTDNVDEV